MGDDGGGCEKVQKGYEHAGAAFHACMHVRAYERARQDVGDPIWVRSLSFSLSMLQIAVKPPLKPLYSRPLLCPWH